MRTLRRAWCGHGSRCVPTVCSMLACCTWRPTLTRLRAVQRATRLEREELPPTSFPAVADAVSAMIADVSGGDERRDDASASRDEWRKLQGQWSNVQPGGRVQYAPAALPPYALGTTVANAVALSSTLRHIRPSPLAASEAAELRVLALCGGSGAEVLALAAALAASRPRARLAITVVDQHDSWVPTYVLRMLQCARHA